MSHGSNATTNAPADAAKEAAQTAQHQTSAFDAHIKLLIELTAADPRLGKAYGLGRALADSCQKPKDLAGLQDELKPERIANLLRWLDDLASAFPPHAGQSVAKSLTRWRDAIWPPEPDKPSGVRERFRLWQNRRRLPKRLESADDPAVKTALSTLHRQGELWRALLSGEKQGTDMLGIDNYLDAATGFAARSAGIIRRTLWRMPALTFAVFALVVGGIVLLATGASAHLVAGATSVLAALSLTWKGLGGVLGQLAGKLGRPLWEAVLDDVIADAITLLPDNRQKVGERLTVALGVSDEHRTRTQGEPSEEPAEAATGGGDTRDDGSD